MAAIGVITYRNTWQLLEHADSIAHTQKVLAETAGLRISVTDAESAERAYLLTGDVKFLNSVESLKIVAESRKALRQLTVDNARQQRALDMLEPLLDRKIALVREIVA